MLLCFCCEQRGYGARWPRSGKSPQPPPPTAIDARVRQGSPASDSGVAGVNAKGLPGSLYDMGPDAGGSHAELVADHSSQRQSRRSFQAWCGTTYADFILAPKVKLALLLTGAIFLAVCVWGITLVDDGLDIDVSRSSWVLPAQRPSLTRRGFACFRTWLRATVPKPSSSSSASSESVHRTRVSGASGWQRLATAHGWSLMCCCQLLLVVSWPNHGARHRLPQQAGRAATV